MDEYGTSQCSYWLIKTGKPVLPDLRHRARASWRGTAGCWCSSCAWNSCVSSGPSHRICHAPPPENKGAYQRKSLVTMRAALLRWPTHLLFLCREIGQRRENDPSHFPPLSYLCYTKAMRVGQRNKHNTRIPSQQAWV